MPRYDVFLSHASADKPAVEHLAHRLRKEGIEPFLDKWHLIPGEPWQEAVEEALDQSRTCAVFLGRTISPWQNEEMRTALEARVREDGFRVIPVLLPGGREPGQEKLPGFLRRLTWVDFRAGIDQEDAFRFLLAGIRGQAPGPGGGGGEPHSLLDRYRSMAPARELFVQRGEYGKVRDSLLLDGARGTTVGITTAIQGAGGFGKTALAIELCSDEKVRAQYPDGILWTTMGEEIDAAGRLSRVRDLIRWWAEEDPPAFETVSAASAHLRQELNGKRVLLVVDDVWRPEDVTPFQGLGPGTALLITTRDSGTLPADSAPVHVDAMKISEAVQLLGAGLPAGMDGDLQKLANRLGEWPLLLKITHRQLRELMQQDGLSLEQSIREVNEALDAEGLTVFDREDLESRGRAVARTVGASLRRLNEDEVGRFEQLAIFPEDKDIPLRVLEKLWGLGSFATKKLCGRLHDLSLLLRFDRPAGTMRLHDVIRAYLLKKGESRIVEWNQRLLETYRQQNDCWSDLPKEESYLWIHLPHHLMGAGQSDVCRELLLDFQYLAAKLAATDINALLADYSFFGEYDQELRFVRDALRLSAHILSRDPDQLRVQLWGRLRDRDEAALQNLLQEAEESSSAPWFRPRTASLARPGGALIRTIEHPGIPEMLAVLENGLVVSSSTDRSLRIWDLESGRMLRVVEGDSICAVAAVSARGRWNFISGSFNGSLRGWDPEHELPRHFLDRRAPFISCLAVLDDGRVISGAMDRALRVWDLESGQELMALKGHTGGITSVAVLDRQRVVSSSVDGTLRVWEVDTGRTLAVLEGCFGPIQAVAVLNGRQVVSGSANGTVQVWDLESRQTVAVLEGHSAEVNAVAVLADRRVVSGSADRTLRLWDVDSRQTLAVLEGHFHEVKAVAALDSQRVVSASADRTLRVWDLDHAQTRGIAGHTLGVTAVAALDHRRAVSGSVDRTLRIWDIESGQPLAVLEGHLKRVTAVAALDSRRVVSGSSDGTLRVWDADSGKTLIVLPASEVAEVFAVAVLDGRRVVSGSSDGALRIWDVESGEALAVLPGNPADLIYAVTVLDSRRVISGSYDGMIQRWDLDSNQATTLFLDASAIVHALAVWDRHRVVSGFADGMLRVHDIGAGQVLAHLQGHSADVQSLALLDDRRLVSCGRDRTLRVWNLETGATECLVALDAPVLSVAVVPGSRVVIAGDASGRVHFFDFVDTLVLN